MEEIVFKLEPKKVQDCPSPADHPKGQTVSEKSILLNKTHRVSRQTAVRLRHGAVCVSWVSVVTALVLGTLATVYAWYNDSQSLFSFGLDALLDSASSVIVVWRFCGTSPYSDFKEKRACAMIGILFVLSAFALVGKAIWSLGRQEHTDKLAVTLILAGVNAGVCLILGLTKIVLGYKLESRALRTDSVITLTGAAMAVFTLIFSQVYKQHAYLWYLDDTFGILCSVFLLVYGLWVIWTSLAGSTKPTSTSLP